MDYEFIVIDGSYGEGGGSIVRLSMAFAALLKKPISIINIRSKRDNPGLRTQHLIGIQLIQQIFGGFLQGAEVGSIKVNYIPELEYTFSTDKITVNINTAASIGLILQSLQLAMVNIRTKVLIELVGGGTYGLWAPSIDFIQHVTLPYLRFFGCHFEIQIPKHGFYPKGGSKVNLVFNPSKDITSSTINIESRESKLKIYGKVIASNHLQRSYVAERIAKSAIAELNKNGIENYVETNYVDSISPGAGITLWSASEFPFGTSFVSQRNISSEKAGQLVVENFLKDWHAGGVVDEYMTDQLIPFMALHPAKIITGPLSNHTRTNIWICQKFVKTKFIISELSPTLNLIQTEIAN